MSEPLNIVIVRHSIAGLRHDGIADEARAIVPDARVRLVDPDELDGVIEDADVVAAARVAPHVFQRAKRLKWLQSWTAGPNDLMHDGIRASPVLVTSCKGNGAIPLAEHAMMLMLMLNRKARRLLAAQMESHWDKFHHGELNGRTCGIIGVGHSGSDLALKARAFHMRVLGLRRRNEPAEHFDRVYTQDALHDFLAECDYVVVTAALTEATHGMLGEAEFRAMKPTAFYVCISRGAIADAGALARALTEGWIAGAGLDAHAVEPLPPDSPFWSMPNVIVTPHIGATAPETFQRGDAIFLENLRRFVAGEPLINVVDKTAGY